MRVMVGSIFYTAVGGTDLLEAALLSSRNRQGTADKSCLGGGTEPRKRGLVCGLNEDRKKVQHRRLGAGYNNLVNFFKIYINSGTL